MQRLAILVLLTVASLCLVDGKPSAMAAVIEFDNSATTFVLVANGNFFDPRIGPSSQAGADVTRSIGYGGVDGGGSESPQVDFLRSGPMLGHARSTTPIDVTNRAGTVFTFFPAETFATGELVGGGANFQATAATALFYVGGGHFHTPFLGQSPYTGFRLDLPDGPHFGWVQWNFTIGPLAGGGEIPMYQPIRWAYETEPNVPIVVPGVAPGAVLLLSAGVLAAPRRRRA